MNISVIVPAHNSEKTIGLCLDSILSDMSDKDEVIVVDDASSDGTAEILREYGCRVVRRGRACGAAAARNEGASTAKGDILCFVDSDVILPAGTLSRLRKYIMNNPEVAAISLSLDPDPGVKGFFSDYKNLYMVYILDRSEENTDFLYGCFMAMRKEDFLPFDQSYRMTDDTELGKRYASLSRDVRLIKSIKVSHLKEYNCRSFFMNDFRVPFWWARTFLRYGSINKVSNGFAHAGMDQLVSIPAAYLAVALIPLCLFSPAILWIVAGLISLHFLLWIGLLKFLYRLRGIKYIICVMPVMIADSIIRGAGIMAGLVFFGLLKRGERKR